MYRWVDWSYAQPNNPKIPGPPCAGVPTGRVVRPNAALPDAQIREWLTEVVHPVTLNQVAVFYQRVLRDRALPVMIAVVVSRIWRQLGFGCEVVGVRQREGMRWRTFLNVTWQAVGQRHNALPASLFHAVLQEVPPQMQQRTRPLLAVLAWARQ